MTAPSYFDNVGRSQGVKSWWEMLPAYMRMGPFLERERDYPIFRQGITLDTTQVEDRRDGAVHDGWMADPWRDWEDGTTNNPYDPNNERRQPQALLDGLPQELIDILAGSDPEKKDKGDKKDEKQKAFDGLMELLLRLGIMQQAQEAIAPMQQRQESYAPMQQAQDTYYPPMQEMQSYAAPQQQSYGYTAVQAPPPPPPMLPPERLPGNTSGAY